MQKTFVDSSRINRSVTTEIYYPAATAGNNVPVSAGQFPVLVFGHGFTMVWSAYDIYWNALVPTGYIMVFPTTEGGFSPNHLEFGKDLAFLIGEMKKENLNLSSAFFNHVTNTSAVMGHSMGGGSSFLSVQYDSSITALVNFAAAETTPSAIAAAKNILIPSLVFSGANDCVAPPTQHQSPLYDSLASACKSFVSITGGSHCQFASYNVNCYFGEGTCTPQATITPTVQQGIFMPMLQNFLDYYLKNDCNAGTLFQNAIAAANGITSQQNCSLTCLGEEEFQILSSMFQIFPNPFSESAGIQAINGRLMENCELKLYDIFGMELKIDLVQNPDGFVIRKSNLPSGIYIYKITTESNTYTTGKLIIQ